METLTLKNGSTEPEAVIVTTMMALKSLWGAGIPGICAVADLHERCRNPQHPIANDELKMLKSFELIQSDGRIHDTIKNVVLSAISGKGCDLTMGTPFEEPRSVKAPSLDEAESGDTPSLEEIVAVIDGIYGLQQCIMGSVDHHGVTMQELGVFIRNTPNGKRGEELWREFTSRRDKSQDNYNFVDFIKEVVAEASS